MPTETTPDQANLPEHNDDHAHEHDDGHVHGPGCSHGHHAPAPYVREAPKLGRNDPCRCGSGKKFKKCCAAGT